MQYDIRENRFRKDTNEMGVNKIVVLAAGTSTEREVSINSGYNICSALRTAGYDAVLVDVFFGSEETALFGRGEDYPLEAQAEQMRQNTPKVEAALQAGAPLIGTNVIELCRQADFVFLGLHGQNGEDGRLQAMFDLLGIRYSGTGHLGSAMAMDKGVAKQVLMGYQIPTPEGKVLKSGELSDALQQPAPYLPCVVKPCCGGSSIGVYICRTEEEYKEGLKQAFAYEDEIVIEQYIQGRELSIGVIDGKALPVIEIIADGWYDYENKYSGKTKDVCPAEIDEAVAASMQRDAERAAEALKLEAYSRMDFLLDEDGRYYCLEANTLPGMTAVSLLPQEAGQLGMDFPALCDYLVKVSMKKYEKN